MKSPSGERRSVTKAGYCRDARVFDGTGNGNAISNSGVVESAVERTSAALPAVGVRSAITGR